MPAMLIGAALAASGAGAQSSGTMTPASETRQPQASPAATVSSLSVSPSATALEDADAYIAEVLTLPNAALLRDWHDKTSSRPHVAGTPGDAANRDMLEREFAAMGLTVERHAFTAYMPRQGSASVRVLVPGGEPIELELREPALPQDPSTAHSELMPAWNAYSGSGVAEGEVVYVNYGRLEDFRQLAQMGVDLTGKIAIARYGGNFRGYKAKFAEEAGAAGLLMYTDPMDSGYMRGLEYPEGGYQGAGSIQRGSIKTLPYAGDPLTPGIEATPQATRLKPEEVALPKIPVQAIGWGGAKEILSRLDGPAVPRGWQGGLPFTYRVSGSERAVKVRLEVDQPRELVESSNVIAMLPGTMWPDEWVVVGCHRDAWGMGAGDPDAGMIVVLEAARAFAELARRGERPKRTIVFAGWGAEEYGIIGSTEWVERHASHLGARAVAYLNLDMASMGPNFRSSAHPALHDAVRKVARVVPQARDAERTVHEVWGGGGEPRLGVLGGGSDHVAFLCHVGVPSVALGGGGSEGVSYHTNYDTLAWYRQVVGDDYEPALMVTRMTVALTAELASAPMLMLDPAGQTRAFLEHLAAYAGRLPIEPLVERAAKLTDRADRVRGRLERLATEGVFDQGELRRINSALKRIDRAWIDPAGLPERPWYRNLTVSPNPESGYSHWVLPGLVEASRWGEDRAGDVQQMLGRYDAALSRVEQTIIELEGIVTGG